MRHVPHVLPGACIGARQGLGSLRCRQQSPVLSSLPRRAPTRSAPPPPVSRVSYNELGAEGATALSSGLTALMQLQDLYIR